MDQADLHHHQREDAEPDGLVHLAHAEELQPHDHRVEDRDGQQDHRQGIHHAAQQQVEQEDGAEDQDRRQAAGLDPLGELGGHLGQGQAGVEQVGAEQHEEDHPTGFGGAQQAALQPLPAQAALGQRQQTACGGANGGRLGGVGPAAVDADYHHQEHAQHRQHLKQCLEPLRRAGRLAVMVAFGLTGDHQAHHDDVAQRRQQARHHRGDEQLGNGFLGQHRIDDQRHRGRDEDAQGAPRRHGGGGQAAGVVVPAQLRQRHLAHGRRGGERRTADRAETGTGANGGHAQSTAQVADEGRRAAEDGLGQAAVGGELAHQHEQRDHRQVVVGQARPGQVVEAEQQRREVAVVHREEAQGAAHQHGQADVHAQHQQGEGGGQRQQAKTESAHGRCSRVRQ
ncbi:hypothetical protein D3C84_351000 [compost metagenome]